MKKLFILGLLLWGSSVLAQKIHIRTFEGTPPYTYVVKDAAGTTLSSRQSSLREEVFAYPGGTYSYTVTDAAGKSETKRVDGVSAALTNTYLKGFSNTYSNPNQDAVSMDEMAAVQGMNCLAVSFQAWDYMRTQAEWNSAVWTQRFDHTLNRGINPDMDTFACRFDKTVYEAKRRGLKLRVGLQPLRTHGILQEDGYPFTYGYNDLMRTPDGQRLKETSQTVFFFFQYPSFASDQAKSYYAQFVAKFCYRYKQAIEDGTIVGMNFWFTDSGEFEYESVRKVFNDQGQEIVNEMSYGDFSDAIREKFAAFYLARFGSVTAFNAKMGTTITALNKSQLTGSLLLNGPEMLQKHYQWFQMKMMSDFESYVQEFAYAQAGLVREKVWILDVGSIFDGNLYRRKNLNINARIRAGKRWAFIKSNNTPEQGDYAIEQITSAARYAGAQAWWEPSPSYATFNNQGQAEAVNKGYQKGASLSCFIPSPSAVPNFSWQTVANMVSLGSKPSYFTAVDDKKDGQPLTITLKFKDVCLDGKDTHIGDYRISSAYQAAKQANPSKDINIFIDDSDILGDFINP